MHYSGSIQHHHTKADACPHALLGNTQKPKLKTDHSIIRNRRHKQGFIQIRDYSS